MFDDILGISKLFLKCEEEYADYIPSFIDAQGLNMWPAYRMAYYFDTNKGVSHYVANNFSYANCVNVVTRGLPEDQIKRIEGIAKQSCLVFSVDSLHVEKNANKRYDPYLDQVYIEAQRAGLFPVKIVLSKKHDDNRFVQAIELDDAVIDRKSILLSNFPPIPHYDESVEFFLSRACPVVHPLRVWLFHSEIISYANYFAKILSILQPKIVVLQEYYNVIAMGLSLACRSAGIPCIEYQHGVQSWPHFFYCFPSLPKSGFECVPEWFFTWGEKPASDLRKQFAGQNFHKVAITGKPNYIAWRHGDFKDDPRLLAEFAQRLENRIPICVPLPLFYASPQEVELLRQVIAASPPEWLWLFRQHPLLSCANGTALLEEFADRIESELSSRLSLHAVLSHCKHMVFESSSACHEAISLHRMRATCISNGGKQLYNDSIRDADVVYASTVEGVLQSIIDGIDAYPHEIQGEPYLTQDTNLLRAALFQLGRGKAPVC